jgi:hypothetical protein
MEVERALVIAGALLFVVVLASALFVGEAQENKERLAFSNGQGTLTVGEEKFKLNSVAVKLLSDQKAELTLVSDITVFLTATWSTHDESPQEIDLQMGGESRGGMEGTGKVVLKNEGKAVARLTLKGTSRATKRPVEANFEGK